MATEAVKEKVRKSADRPQRWLEVTSDLWMVCAHYCTRADYRTVKRAAAREWRENTGNECKPQDFKVRRLKV